MSPWLRSSGARLGNRLPGESTRATAFPSRTPFPCPCPGRRRTCPCPCRPPPCPCPVLALSEADQVVSASALHHVLAGVGVQDPQHEAVLARACCSYGDAGWRFLCTRLAHPTTSVTIAGSLQSVLGCPGDWQPDCAPATRHRTSRTRGASAGTFGLPAGAWNQAGGSERSLPPTGHPDRRPRSGRFYCRVRLATLSW